MRPNLTDMGRVAGVDATLRATGITTDDLIKQLFARGRLRALERRCIYYPADRQCAEFSYLNTLDDELVRGLARRLHNDLAIEVADEKATRREQVWRRASVVVLMPEES